MNRFRLIVLLSLASLSLQAQESRIGIDAAFNSTWLFNKNVSDAGDELDQKSTFGLQVGAAALINFGNNMGISTGLSLTQVNQKYVFRNFPNTPLEKTFDAEQKLSYLDIPLLFRYTSTKGAYFEVGPQVGFLMSAKETDINGDKNDNKDAFNGTNISAQVGFGIDLVASDNLVFTAGFRFGYGLTDATKKSDGAGDGYEPTHTGVGGVHLGLAYKLGGSK